MQPQETNTSSTETVEPTIPPIAESEPVVGPPHPVVEPVTPVELVPAAPVTPSNVHVKKMPRQRHFLILFFFSFMWGTFGVDRFYMGYIGTGILKLLTVGGLGLWTLTDFVIVMTGAWKDKQGRLTLQAEEYKKFASRTVLWFTIILAVAILLGGLELILSVTSLINSLQGGGASSIPGLDQLTGGGDQSQINSLLKQ